MVFGLPLPDRLELVAVVKAFENVGCEIKRRQLPIRWAYLETYMYVTTKLVEREKR